MYKLAIVTLSTATLLSAVGYGAAARPSDARSAGAGSHPVSIRGSVTGPDGDSLAGADVCIYDGEAQRARGCMSSASDGSFALPVDAHERLIVMFRKEGFAPTMRAIETVPAAAREGRVAFLVTAPGAQPTTASVTRTPLESKAPLYFSVALDREETEL